MKLLIPGPTHLPQCPAHRSLPHRPTVRAVDRRLMCLKTKSDSWGVRGFHLLNMFWLQTLQQSWLSFQNQSSNCLPSRARLPQGRGLLESPALLNRSMEAYLKTGNSKGFPRLPEGRALLLTSSLRPNCWLALHG